MASLAVYSDSKQTLKEKRSARGLNFYKLTALLTHGTANLAPSKTTTPADNFSGCLLGDASHQNKISKIEIQAEGKPRTLFKVEKNEGYCKKNVFELL